MAANLAVLGDGKLGLLIAQVLKAAACAFISTADTKRNCGLPDAQAWIPR